MGYGLANLRRTQEAMMFLLQKFAANNEPGATLA